MKKLLSSEPALFLGLLQAAVALAVSFGLDLSPEQVGALMAFSAALLAVVLRQTVVSATGLVQVAKNTAESLSGPSAGAVGTVTAKGAEIVDTVVSEVGGLLPKLAPKAKEI